MDLKNILEKQIEELQEVQKNIPKKVPEYVENTCKLAELIMKLASVISTMN